MMFFLEEDFLMCSVTDREMAEPQNNISVENRNISITNQDKGSTVEEAAQVLEFRASTSREKPAIVSPELVRPFAKAPDRKTTSTKRKKTTSRILTSTPVKTQIENETIKARSKKKTGCRSFDSKKK